MNVWSRQTFAPRLKASKPIPTRFARQEVAFGTLAITERIDELAPERLKMIFDPVPRVDGIMCSNPAVPLSPETTQARTRRIRVQGPIA